ncbi:IclR family transcriptional regulator domain-containing protein [Streptomyces maremycinicus]|uniref:IclR family transcriptional regulator domain-containing protein n=1 Tax=Streptomyces maremycinicus TaxID=1679753 RepID=UPI001F1E98C9|nr:IclR family transcriptional regulator C-terminal domain-containing protein [Streptomyces sp. NBRC 110468]
MQRAGEAAHADEVERSLASARTNGYALSRRADHPGLLGISVPLLTTPGHATASVAISGPSDRWTARRAMAMADVLTERSARLAALLATSPSAGRPA